MSRNRVFFINFLKKKKEEKQGKKNSFLKAFFASGGKVYRHVILRDLVQIYCLVRACNLYYCFTFAFYVLHRKNGIQ